MNTHRVTGIAGEGAGHMPRHAGYEYKSHPGLTYHRDEHHTAEYGRHNHHATGYSTREAPHHTGGRKYMAAHQASEQMINEGYWGGSLVGGKLRQHKTTGSRVPRGPQTSSSSVPELRPQGSEYTQGSFHITPND